MTQELKYRGGYGTVKQIEARTRNRKIFQLRGIYSNAKSLLNQESVAAIKILLDKALGELSAETIEAYEKRREEFFSKERTDEEYKQFQKPFGGKPRG